MRSDAQATVEFAILDGLCNEYGSEDFAVIVKSIMASLFSDATIWAVNEYLEEIAGEKCGVHEQNGKYVADNPSLCVYGGRVDEWHYANICTRCNGRSIIAPQGERWTK